ncbi:uncharacterized protein BT62DRAFT_990195 [Guyanagaster necrorhizus]|uniref:Uncharacterized protein n=1 Tax=Guyanagaster necrorhizus TaxID=856835 RepID=A0A9P7W3Y0_9AGAR|nr:uncharacterized protein BT62DRAFT_990195 [Guyanagaster necrorhizus MCA 3950]KAG7451722.1 hypothetical protein BT62DRAFT_990195 [Guyanagaster necrorhizus MCA 3950]
MRPYVWRLPLFRSVLGRTLGSESAVVMPDSLVKRRLAFSARRAFPSRSRLHWSSSCTLWRSARISNDASGRKVGAFRVFVFLNAILCALVIGHGYRERFRDILRSKIEEESPYRKTEDGKDSLEFVKNCWTAVALKMYDTNYFHRVDLDDYTPTVNYFCGLYLAGMVEFPVETFFWWNARHWAYHRSVHKYRKDLLLCLPKCEMRDMLHARMRAACKRLHALLTDSRVQGALSEMHWMVHRERRREGKAATAESKLRVSELGERCVDTLTGIIESGEAMVDYTLIDGWHYI